MRETVLENLPLNAVSNAAIYDRLRGFVQSSSSSHSNSTSFYAGFNIARRARLSTPALTEDVPELSDEPSAAAGVACLPLQASINDFRIQDSSCSPLLSESSSVISKPIGTTPKQLLLLQLNARGIWKRHAELSQLVHQNPPAVISLQEMFTKTTDNLLKSKYNWQTINRNKQGGCGIAGIGVLKEIPHSFVNVNSNLLVCVSRISWPIEVSIVSIYVPCRSDDHQLIVDLNLLLRDIEPPFLFSGDFNAAHEAWGAPKSTKRGRLLLEWAVDNNLHVINTGASTHLSDVHGTFSSIDLTIASNCLVPKLFWDVHDDFMGSDHAPIIVSTNDPIPKHTVPKRWLYKDADWAAYEKLVDIKFSSISSQSIEQITQSIIEAATVTIPKSSGKAGKTSQIWWTKTVSKAVKIWRKKLRALRKLDDGDPKKEEALRQFKKARSEARKIIEDAKVQSWNQFCESFTPTTGSAKIWQNFNKLSGKRKTISSGLCVKGQFTTDTRKIANAFAETFEHASATDMNTPNLQSDFAEYQILSNPVIDKPFTMQELLNAIDKSKGHSVGVDNVGYPMVKRLPFSCKIKLLELYNQLWKTGTFPQSWRSGIVIPIPKAGEKHNSTEGFRPITLLNCLGKIYERMINHRLVTHLETNKILHDSQYAFRAGKGTSVYFSDLRDILENAKANDLHCDIGILDLTKAFDRVSRPYIFNELCKTNPGERMVKCIREFLGDRIFEVSINGQRSESKSQQNDVPQGSVLSPTLFILAMNSIFSCVPKKIEILLYADDIVLVVTGKSAKPTRQRLIEGIKAVEHWAETRGFLLSGKKSSILHVCQRKHHHMRAWNVEPLIHSGTIRVVRYAKILGVTIDQRRSFCRHVREIKESLRNKINFLKAISRKASRTVLLRIGEAICVSKMLYGIEIVGLQNVSKLEGIYNKIVRIASGVYPTTPTQSVLAEAGCLPFKYKAALTLTARAAGITEKNANVHLSVLQDADNAMRTITGCGIPPISKLHRPHCRPWLDKVPSIDWSIKSGYKVGNSPTIARNLFFELVRTKYTHHKHFYTDGSVAGNRTGFGIVSDKINFERQLPPACTIFSAEAAALARAILLVPKKSPAIIVTDSASCLEALHKGASKHPFIQQIEKKPWKKEDSFRLGSRTRQHCRK